ncbi:unnamed protein product, partial [Meganyctiphanes norvegica]
MYTTLSPLQLKWSGSLNGGSNPGIRLKHKQVPVPRTAAPVDRAAPGPWRGGVQDGQREVQSHQYNANGIDGSNDANGVSAVMDSNSDSSSYLEGLLQEQRSLKGREGVDLIKHLLGQEIERLQTTGKSILVRSEDRKLSDITKDKAVKLTIRVLVPVKDHPKFNFVGKLLGPRGMSLKRLQEETMTKMAILGRGSMRDKQKQKLCGSPCWKLSTDLIFVEEYNYILYGKKNTISKQLGSDYNDDIRQEQMREIKLMKTTTPKRNSSPDMDTLGPAPASEDESCSPSSPGSVGGGDHEALHPALRGLNGKTQQLKEGQQMSRGFGPSSNGRRSVLSLLTRGRIIQQKEHLIDVYNQLPGYGIYDQMNDLPMSDSPNEDNSEGRYLTDRRDMPAEKRLKIEDTANAWLF